MGQESCAIYCRISQDRHGEKAGVERQEEDCRKLADRLGFAVDGVYVDNDASATSGVPRPQFEEMLTARPEAILAWHQDRLLRLTSDLERVIDLGVPVHFVHSGSLDLSTPAGRAVARTVAAWSQYETEQKGLRRQAANVQRAHQGEWQFSRRPYGYARENGRVVQVPDEAATLRGMYASYAAGDSYRMISERLNDEGAATTSGGRWTAEVVQGTLANPRYAGIVMHKGQRLPGVRPQWEPIITRDVWNNYERVRQGRKKKGAPSAGKPKHLLSGFAVCGKCGDRLYAHKVARPVRKDGTRAHPYRVYDCMKNRCVSIQADRLDEVAEKIVIARLQSAEVLQAIHTPQDVKPIVNELDDLNSRRSAIVGLLSDGLIDMENARADLERLAAKHGRLERKLESLREHSPLTDIALAHSIPDRWKALPIMTRRSIIDTLGLRITVNPGQRGYVALARDGSRTIDLRRLVITWVS